MGEASEVFGGLSKAVQRLAALSVTPRWLPIPKDNRNGFVFPHRRNSVPRKRLRSSDTHKAGGSVNAIIDGRIDDPDAGWAGRGVWATYGAAVTWHIEGGQGVKPGIIKFQIRPDPLAN